MKKIVIMLMLTTILLQGFSQEASETKPDEKEMKVLSDTNEKTKVVIGNDLLVVEDGKGEVKVRIANRGLSILESLEGPRFTFDKDIRENDRTQYYREEDRTRRARRFKGHWSGVEFGFNNYNYVRSMDLPEDINYMSLRSSKSTCFNINFSQISIGIFRHFGIVTGLGLNWNNYVFAGNNNIIAGNFGVIEELIPNDNVSLKKSKFTTLYLNSPAMLELQLPAGEGHSLNIGAGVIGGILVGSHTKMSFEDGRKLKSYRDLSMNLLRGGLTARVGYENFMIYGSYYLTPWFKEGKGPGFYNLEPIEIGLAFTFND